MKKLLGLAMAGIAIFVLSGCAGDGFDRYNEPNVKITYHGYEDMGYTQYTMVEVYNASSFDIDRILTRKYNNSFTEVTPPRKVFSGQTRLFRSSNCIDSVQPWTIRIVEETGNYAEEDFQRQCGYKEKFIVRDL